MVLFKYYFNDFWDEIEFDEPDFINEEQYDYLVDDVVDFYEDYDDSKDYYKDLIKEHLDGEKHFNEVVLSVIKEEQILEKSNDSLIL